jgi:hypothetical protein
MWRYRRQNDPAGTAAVEALADTEVRLRLAELGFETFPREQQTPEALSALMAADAEKWWPIIKDQGRVSRNKHVTPRG